MLVSGVIEQSKSWIPYRRTFRNFTHQAWAIWDVSNHDLFQIIPNQGSQQMVTLSLASLCTIPFQAKARDVKISKLRQDSPNCEMPGFVNVLGTFQGTWNQPAKYRGPLFWCVVDIFLDITNCEIKWPGMLIARKISQVSLVGYTYDWHTCRYGSKLILCIPSPTAGLHLAVDSMTLRVSELHRFKIEVHLKWEMCQNELDTFENIPVVSCSEDMWVIFNPTVIATTEIEFKVELSWGIGWVESFDFEVVQSTPEMLINPGCPLLAKPLSLLKVVCGPKWMPWIPLFWVLSMLVVQFSSFTISFPPHIFHSNYLPMIFCLGWIRGIGEIRLLRVYRFFIGSILQWWCTRYIV